MPPDNVRIYHNNKKKIDNMPIFTSDNYVDLLTNK